MWLFYDNYCKNNFQLNERFNNKRMERRMNTSNNAHGAFPIMCCML